MDTSVYLPSGRVGEAFWPWLLVWLAVAALGGGIEAFIYSSDPLVAWILAMALAFWIGLAGTLVTRAGHCRSRGIAAVCGLLAALVLLVSGWTIDQHRDTGQANPATLHRYLEWRVETGRHLSRQPGSEREPSDDQRLPQPWLGLAWAGFGVGVGTAFFLSVLLPWRLPRTDPYCEPCSEWMARDVFALAPGATDDAVEAVRQGRLAPLLDHRGSPFQPGVESTLVAIHSCSKRDRCAGDLGFASVAEGGKGPSLVGPFHPSEQFLGRLPLELGRMAGPDLLALRSELGSSWDGRAHQVESHLALGREDGDDEFEDGDPGHGEGPPPRIDLTANAFRNVSLGKVSIEPIRDRTAGVVLGQGRAALSMLMQLLPALLVLVGLLIPVWVLESGRAAEWPLAQTFAVAGLGALLFLGTLAVFLRNPFYFEGLLPYLAARKSIGSRADATVDMDDPETCFVDVIPRANWGRTLAENASDIGFLRADAARRTLLFEGDRERYSIPGDAISLLEITYLGHSVKVAGVETSLRHALVLHVDLPEKTIEIPFVLRHVPYWRCVRWGRRGAHGQLIEAVAEIMPDDADLEMLLG